MRGLFWKDTFFDLAYSCFSEPVPNIVNAFLEIPGLEFFLGEVPDLPAFQFQNLLREFLHLRWQSVLSLGHFLSMEIDGDFKLMENVVQDKEIMVCGECSGVDETLSLQESLEVHIFRVMLEVIFVLDDIEVLLCMVEFVDEVFEIPFWEMVLQEKLACLEWLVIN